MNLFKLLILVGVCQVAQAQEYVDIATAEYTKTPQNQFDSSLNTSSLQKININVTAPVTLKNGSSLLVGVVYDRLQTKLFEQQEDEVTFSAYTLKLGMNVKYSDKWSATYLLLPKIASNFEESLTKNDYQIGGIILAKLKKSEHFNYKFGAYINGDRFGPFLVPLFGGYYQKNKLEIDVMIPSYAKINYSITPKVTAGVNWRATVKSYNIQFVGISPFYMHHLSNEIAAHIGYEPIKGVIIRGMAGASLGRSFRVYQNNDKIDFGLSLVRFGDDRVPLNTDFENGAFGRLELAYRFYL
jgi:hypothetical protein